jgi:hypothetical protein
MGKVGPNFIGHGPERPRTPKAVFIGTPVLLNLGGRLKFSQAVHLSMAKGTSRMEHVSLKEGPLLS